MPLEKVPKRISRNWQFVRNYGRLVYAIRGNTPLNVNINMTTPINMVLATALPVPDNRFESLCDMSDIDTQKYLTQTADNWFRITKVLEYFSNSGDLLRTGQLPSKVKNMKDFKGMWKSLQERVFRKYRAVEAFGMIERAVPEDGPHCGCLHVHILLRMPEWFDCEEIERFESDLRRAWSAIHFKNSGVRLPPTGMKITCLRDDSGQSFCRYIAKPFNRGKNPAKWGREGNETYHLTANLPAGLWKRDELPSRRGWKNVMELVKSEFLWHQCDQNAA